MAGCDHGSMDLAICLDIQLKPKEVLASSGLVSINITSSSAEMIWGKRSGATWHTTSSGHDAASVNIALAHSRTVSSWSQASRALTADMRQSWSQSASSAAWRARSAHRSIRPCQIISINKRRTSTFDDPFSQHSRTTSASSGCEILRTPSMGISRSRHPPWPYAATNVRSRRARASSSRAEGSPNKSKTSGSRLSSSPRTSGSQSASHAAMALMDGRTTSTPWTFANKSLNSSLPGMPLSRSLRSRHAARYSWTDR